MTDYISRNDALNAFAKVYEFPSGSIERCFEQVKDVYDKINNLPASDVVERKHGKWSPFDDGNGFGFQCSACKCVTYGCSLEIFTGDFKFCPYCGADMIQNEGDS